MLPVAPRPANRDFEPFRSIEAGKLGDLVVLDGDPFSAPEAIGEVKIWMTMIAGTAVFNSA